MEMRGGLSGFFSGKKILITGHTGFKGSWLAAVLRSMGAEVIGYSLLPNTKPNLYSIIKLDGSISSHLHDIRDYEKLQQVFDKEKPEMVFHLAAQPLVRDSYDDPLYTLSTNVIGTANVLECIRKSEHVKAAVIVTTDKVYENKGGNAPHREIDELGGYDPYSSSKVCAEHVTRSYIRSFFNPEKGEPKAFIASARAGNVLGGGDWSKDRIVPDLIRAVMERNEKLVIRNPESVRPWQFVLDPLFGYMLLAKRLYEKDKKAVGAWNFAPEENSHITTEELAKRAIAFLGKGGYSIKRESGKHEAGLLRLDAGKARKELGWKPILGMDECLAWTFEWYKAFYGKEDVLGITNKQISNFIGRCSYG